MLAKYSLAIIILAIVAVAALAFSLASQNNTQGAGTISSSSANGVPGADSLTIVTLSGGKLVPNATYILSPLAPTGSTSSLTVQDGGSMDLSPSQGIIAINDISNGNYSIEQLNLPPEFQRDSQPKIIEIQNGQGTTVTFDSAPVSSDQLSSSSTKSIFYTSKFECGTISGSEGPLRPGHYDTDISIFNKQDFAVKIFISASVIKGKGSNTILQTIESHSASSIVCKDLYQLFGTTSQFTEGFVSIEVPQDPRLLGELADNGSMVVGQQSTQIDPIDVQVFYTANALDSLPHSVYADKISFTILNDSSGKIPASMLQKPLDITVTSDVGQISDPEMQIKQSLADKYGISNSDQDGLKIRIDGVGVGVGTMVDDHAISLSHVLPQVN
jgi:predicted small secreted protein